MKPTSWISIPRVFFRFAPMGKVEKRVLNSIWRYSSIRLFLLRGKAHPKWWYETDVVDFDPKGVFSFRPDGESRKTRFELNLTIFVTSAFFAAWKRPPKILVWNRRRGFRSQGCFFVSPRWGKSKNAFWTQFDDIRQFGFFCCLEKLTQNGGMKPTSWISIPRVFFRFALMGKVEKRVLNSIWRYSSLRLFLLLGKGHPKFWYETDVVDFDPKGVFSFRPDGESRKTRFELNLTIFVNSAFFAAWKSSPKMVVWNRRRGFRSQGCFFVSPRWGKSKNAFWTQFDDIRHFGFFCCLEKATQNFGMKPTSWISIPRVFFRFAPMGKVEKRVLNSIWRYSSIRLFLLLGKAHPKWWYETDVVDFDPKGVFSFRPDGESRKTRFELNLTIFVTSAFFAAWKSPPKILVWNRRRGFRSQGCFFVSPRWGKSKNAFWTQFDDIRHFGFFCCLEKPTQNFGMKPTSWISIPRVFFRFAPMGKVEKRVLNSIWRYSSLRLFLLLGKAHPKFWYETDVVDFDPKGVFSFRPDGESRKTRFELNLTIFVNSAFFAAWKSPPKMVVWNRPRGFRSQGYYFVSPRWGKSKNAFWTQFDDIREFGFLRCLEKPTQNGGMKPISWNSIQTVFFRFAPIGKVEKRVLNSIWLNSAFCAAWKSPPKMVVWNRPRGFQSQGYFFVSPRWGKPKNAFWTQFDDIR